MIFNRIKNSKKFLVCLLVVILPFVMGYSISDEDGGWSSEKIIDGSHLPYFPYEYPILPVYVKKEIIEKSNLDSSKIVSAFDNMNPTNQIAPFDLQIKYLFIENNGVDEFIYKAKYGVCIGYYEDFGQTQEKGDIMSYGCYRKNKYAILLDKKLE
jgi:hypothetical protein